MSGFEEYAKKQQDQQQRNDFIDAQINKGLDIDKASFDYDPEQIVEHFKQRVSDNSADAFAMRTKYYFQDEDMATAKSRRYQLLDQIGTSRGQTDAYAEKYTHHSAKKRKWAAEDASIKFHDMQDKIHAYKNDDISGLDSLTKFRHRKEIMNDRIAAMEKTAYVKAQSKKHEQYLIGRSRLSCNFILKDQLDNFIEAEESKQQVDRNMVRSLKKELSKVEKEIKNATKLIAGNVPKSHDKWREENGLNETSYRRSYEAFKDNDRMNPGCSMDGAVLMTNLMLLQDQQKMNAWPKKSVLTGHGSPAPVISKAEQENKTWNEKYESANGEEKLSMERDALKRFKEFPLPSAAVLNGSARTKKYIMENLRTYYDMTKRALPYYRNLMNNPGNDPISQEIAQDVRLRARITYIEAIDTYINLTLRRKFQIDYDGDNGFRFEQDPQYKYTRQRGRVVRQRKFGFDQNGRDMKGQHYDALRNAYTAYINATNAQEPVINNVQPQQVHNEPVIAEPVNIEQINIINEPENIILNLDQPDQEQKIEAKNTVKNIVDLFDNKNKEDEKEEKKEDKKAGKKNKKILEINLDDIEENLSKSGFKDDEINIIKPEKVDLIEKIERGFLYYKVDGKSYRFTNEFDEQYNEYHKKQPRINRRVFNTYMINKQITGMKLNKEYKDAFEKTGNEIRDVGFNNSTMERTMQCIMKPVIFDKKGKPLTKEDEENHKWNLKWFKCWENGKTDKKTAESMVAEYLPHVYDTAGELLDIFEKYANKSKAVLQDELEKYFEKLIDSNQLKTFIHMSNCAASIDNLRKRMPSVGNFLEKNKKFKAISDIVDFSKNALVNYLENTYGIAIEQPTVEMGVLDEATRIEHTQKNKTVYESIIGVITDIYKDNKDVINKKTDYTFEKGEKAQNKTKITRVSENKNVIKENRNVIKNEPAYHIIDKAKIAEYKKINPGLKNDAIKFLKGYNTGYAMKYCPEYVKLLNKSTLFDKKDSAKSLDRTAAYIMRPVSFDENYKPYNDKQNMANHEWNLKWLKAWEKVDDKKKDSAKIKQQNQAVIKSMIEEETKNTWKKEDIPPIPKVDKLDEAGKEAYKKELENWIEKKISENGGEFFADATLKLLSYNQLITRSPDLKKVFEEEKDREALEDFLLTVHEYAKNYIAKKYGIDLNEVGDSKVIPEKEVVFKNVNYDVMMGVFLEESIAKGTKYKEINKEAAKEKKKEENLNRIIINEEEENLNSINIINEGPVLETKEDRAKEYARLKKLNPEYFTEKAYDYYKKVQKVTESIENPELVSSFSKAKDKIKFKSTSNANFSRACGALLRFVNYDKNGDPVSDKDKENDAFNKKWVKAWTKDDVKLREEMIKEELPKMLKNISIPDIPDDIAIDLMNPKKQKAAALKAKEIFNNWFEKIMDSDKATEFLFEMKKIVLISNLATEHGDAVNPFLKEHPELDKALMTVGSMNNLITLFFTSKYGFTGKKVHDKSKELIYPKNYEEDQEKNKLVPSIGTYAMFLQDYKKDFPDSRYIDKSTGSVEKEKDEEKDDFFAFIEQQNKERLEKERKEPRKGVKFKLPKEADIEKEYAEFCKKNDRLTKPAFNVYKAYNAVYSTLLNPELLKIHNKAVKKGRIKMTGNNASDDISRIPGALLRKVHYDLKNKPISQEDYENHQWNKEVLTAFEKGNNEKLNEIISQEVPNIYSGIKLPMPPKNAGDKWFGNWIENEFMQDPEKWIDFFRKHIALENLIKESKFAKEIATKDADINAIQTSVTFLSVMTTNYLRINYRVNLEQKGPKIIMECKSSEKATKKYDDNFTIFLKSQIGGYSEALDKVIEANPKNSYLDKESNEDKEFKKYHEADPKFTKDSYKVLKMIRKSNIPAGKDPLARAEFQNLLDMKNKKGSKTKFHGSGSLERDLSLPFKFVEYDEDLQPLTEKDKKNQKANLEYIKAWQNNDQEKIDAFLEEEVPKIFDNIELPPMPTDEESNDIMEANTEGKGFISYSKKIEDFVMKLVKDDTYTHYMNTSNKSLALNTLKNNSDSFKLYLKMNPKVDALFDAIQSVCALANAIFTKKYHVTKDGPLHDPLGGDVDKWGNKVYRDTFAPNLSALVLNLSTLSKYKDTTLGDYIKTKDMTAEHKKMLKEK
jgi:hypothetical protein